MKRAAVGVFLAAYLLAAAAAAVPAPEIQSAFAARAPLNGAADSVIDGVIVKFRPGSPHFRKQLLSAADVAGLAETAAAPLIASRAMSGDRQVLKLQTRLSAAAGEAAAQRLALDPGVEYAVPDRRKFPHRVPNDELYGFQWNYNDPVAGINLPAAWDLTTGASSVVVAIADTGSRPHPDAAAALSGYDFISDPFAANDGDGRDASPVDTGDGVTPADALTHPELTVSPSSWHGEFVAGLIGAMGNNAIGIAGVDWSASLFHARVLGIGGGADSDILDGISWAAGLAVPGVPDNPHPAQIINMSLGGSGACGGAYQETFNTLVAAGKIIVVSAGNNAADVANTSPANCDGAIVVVAATGRTGARASYSNFGTVPYAITLSAPGGDGPYADTILSLSNTGEYAPANEFYAWKQGTSFSAAQVSGVVALMLSVNPGLTPAQVVQALRDTARAFPNGTTDDCDTLRCGGGIVDAHAAVLLAQQLAAPAVIPATGFWRSPNAPGIGFTIEKQSGNLFMASYLFAASGRATWYGSGPAAMDGAAYLGTLDVYAGGQTLYGAYQPASITGSAGDMSLSFSSPTQGTLIWPGGTIPVERLDFGPGGSGAVQPASTPEAGWWWSPAEGGRGYAIEIQGNTLLLTGYMYDASGNPVWYLSGPTPMTNSTTYQGQWQQFAGGPTLTGSIQPPQIFNANAGAVTIQFDSTTSATMTLPGGRQIQIQRFRYD
jgi:serine protease